MIPLTLHEPEKLNLAGLMLGSILSQNLRKPCKNKILSSLHGRVGITAGRMQVTLQCEKQWLTVFQGIQAPLNAKIEGDMRAVLDVALGKRLWGLLLTRKIKVSGNLLLLLKLLPLIRLAKVEPDDEVTQC